MLRLFTIEEVQNFISQSYPSPLSPIRVAECRDIYMEQVWGLGPRIKIENEYEVEFHQLPVYAFAIKEVALYLERSAEYELHLENNNV